MAARTSADTLATDRQAPPPDPGTLRLTVVGDAGRVDLAVPPGTDVATLARSYGERVGAATPSLRTAAGAELPPGRGVAECGLQPGDLVVAVGGAAGARAAAPTAVAGPRTLRGGSARLPGAVVAAAAGCALAAAGLVTTGTAAGPVRWVCLLLLVGCAVVSAVPTPTGDVRVARTAVGPAFAAAAGFVAVGAAGPGGLLLGLAVAGLCAAVGAAVARALLTDDDASDLLVVWLVVTSAAAALVVVLLLAGGSVHAVAAVPFGAAVVAVRLLPSVVLDVPDEALLDLDRLAVTAWSARERPRGTRRRSMVRVAGVAAVVRRGRRLVAAGTVAAAVVVAVTGPLLLTATADHLDRVVSRLLVGLGVVALALVARSFRSALPRRVLRSTAAWLLLALGARLLTGLPEDRLTWWFAGLFAAATVTAGSAVLLGRGWRSLWWGRLADVTEGAAVVLVVALVPIASGLFEAIERFVS